jgi:hypothetical protein
MNELTNFLPFYFFSFSQLITGENFNDLTYNSMLAKMCQNYSDIFQSSRVVFFLDPDFQSKSRCEPVFYVHMAITAFFMICCYLFFKCERRPTPPQSLLLNLNADFLRLM